MNMNMNMNIYDTEPRIESGSDVVSIFSYAMDDFLGIRADVSKKCLEIDDVSDLSGDGLPSMTDKKICPSLTDLLCTFLDCYDE